MADQGRYIGNPQVEDGCTRIANELFDAILRFPFTARQLRLLLAILRFTYGWNKRADTIAMKQLVDATGIGEGGIRLARSQLIAKNVVRVKSTRPFAATYCVNKRYGEWKGVSNRHGRVKMTRKVVSNRHASKDILSKDILHYILGMWNQICTSLPALKNIRGQRADHLRKRIEENPGLNWGDFFRSIESSDWLTGRAGKWRATFDWCIKAANFDKIIEGNYSNNQQEGKDAGKPRFDDLPY